MITDSGRYQDGAAAQIGAHIPEGLAWRGHLVAAYYPGEWSAEQIDAGLAGAPVEVYEADNLLVNTGIQLLEDLLIGAGGTTFANANAYIGIGDSSTAAAATQTDLQAATNKLRKAMDATYPSRSNQTLTWRCTFATGEGNFAIAEAGIFNASTSGTMLNRVVQSLGTKTSATTLQVTMTVTIS